MKGGLFTDTSAQTQPEGTYRFALNMVTETNGVSLMSQVGNEFAADLSATLCGVINLDGNAIVLFLAPGTIALYDGTTAMTLYEDDAFAFSRENPITGRFRTVNGCERIIYWCDGVNPDRYFNIDRPERFTDIDDFSFVPVVEYPIVTTSVENGGDLDYGSYRFVVEVLDATQNVILRSHPTMPVSIGSAINDGRDGTNERIRLTITNLDTDFTALRIGVIRFVSGDGFTPTAHYIGDPVVISDSTIEVAYEGYRPDVGESLIDFQTLLTPIVNYRSSHSMTTIHGRLQRYHPVEQVYDFSEFQRAASKIRTTYVVKEVDPDAREGYRTEMGDEVRDYGIIFVTKYGTLTPRFHIPGRAKLPLDEVLVTGTLIGNPGTVEQWRVQNTSPGNGVMAYYESSETYTIPINYGGSDYWGVDVDGNDLNNAPVRYHRFPDRSLEPLYVDGKLRYLGVEFGNIEYPHEDIIGHIITDNEPNINSRTVSGAGYCIPFNDVPDGTGDKLEGRYIHHLNNALNGLERQSNSSGQHFINTGHLVDGRPAQGDYVKMMGKPNYDYRDNRPKYLGITEDDDRVDLYGKHHSFGSHGEIVFEQYRLLDSVSILPRAAQGDYTNRSHSSVFNVLTLESAPASFDELTPNVVYTYVKRNVSPFTNRNGVRHRLFGTIVFDAADTIIYNGHAFINGLSITNVSFFSYPSNNTTGIEYEYLQGLFTESYYDFDRRYNGLSECDKAVGIADNVLSGGVLQENPVGSGVYRGATISTVDVEGAIFFKVFQRTGDQLTEAYSLREGVCREWYGYNKDYSAVGLTTVLPLSYNYDYGSGCLGEYPTKVIWSEVAADEEVVDAWRIHKALNSVDIPADRGPIVKADVHNNQIVVRCSHGCYILRPNPQEIQLTDTTAYLGTGTFLSIPAQGLDFSGAGYGGQQSVLGSVVTPGGLFWADEVSGKVFRFTDTIQEVSRHGMYHFFEEKLRKPSNHNYGLYGALMYYDPTMEMVYLTSSRYEPLRSVVFTGNVPGSNVEGPTRRSSFANRSFTISFDLRAEVWRSFHSFLPAFAFHRNNGFYTTIDRDGSLMDTQLYSHDTDDVFARFYELDYPVVIQVTNSAQGQTVRWQSVQYYATVQERVNGEWKVIRGDTFDQAIAFTDQQSSGLVSLNLTREPYQQVQWSATVKNVVEADQNYRVSSLRDMSVGEPVVSSSWSDIVGYYDDNGQGYIDHVPFNIDVNIPQYDQVYLRDKLVHLRLFYTNSSRRIIAHYVFIRSLPTLR